MQTISHVNMLARLRMIDAILDRVEANINRADKCITQAYGTLLRMRIERLRYGKGKIQRRRRRRTHTK